MNAACYPLILTYHSISEGDSSLKISPALFAEQMNWLRTNTRVAPLGEVVRSLADRKPLLERTVVLTFDDGFKDFYSAAAPVLRRLGLSATAFLPTAYCGHTNGWPSQAEWAKEEPLMSWDQISELSRAGISFGAHSLNHPVLTDLSLEAAEWEIAGSKAQIEERVGSPAEYFAYPYGRWNPVVREIVRRHYRGACATTAGVVEADADPFALPRADACYFRKPALFRSLFTGSFLAYLGARRLIRRLRGKPEGFYARV